MSAERPTPNLEPDPVNHLNLKNLQPPEGVHPEVFDHASGILKHINIVRHDTRPWRDVGSKRMTRAEYIERQLPKIQQQIDKGLLPPEAMDLFVYGEDTCGYEYEPEEQPGGWRE